MPAAYSVDLRKRVLDFIDQGGKIAEACERFSVGRDTIFQWKRLRKKTGSLNPRRRIRKPWKLDYEALQKLVQSRPDSTLKELAQSSNASIGGVRAALVRLKITRKKRPYPTKNVMRRKGKNL